MDGILIAYVLMRLYLCGLTGTVWWGLLVLLACVNLTGLIRIMLYELVTVFMIWWLLMDSNTFERRGANLYMRWFSLTLRFILVSGFDICIMTILVLLIGLSKLPVYGLHQWLPKVHVEASIFGSIILARIILKIRIIFVGLYGFSVPLIMVGLASGVLIMFGSDGKVVMAYSSVIHISLCRLLIGWIGLIVGASHVIISPLIFVAVYVGYIGGRSRLLSPSFNSWIWRVILVVNLGFPLVGRFISELYLIV
jgi:NADH:ubiquinone oxidoreductase subunit 4 (subunit M)